MKNKNNLKLVGSVKRINTFNLDKRPIQFTQKQKSLDKK